MAAQAKAERNDNCRAPWYATYVGWALLPAGDIIVPVYRWR